jgi:hypothetical protein
MATTLGLLSSLEPVIDNAPGHDAHESEWSNYLSAMMPGSEREHELFDGTRVDILFRSGGEHYAIEVDRGMKWHEAIGQATWYGVATNSQPVALLLVKDDRVESRYIYRAMLTGQRAGVSVWVYNIVDNRWTANYQSPALRS